MRMILFSLFISLASALSAVELSAPDRAGVDVDIEVGYSGTVDPRAFVTIVSSDTPEGEYDRYSYAGDGPIIFRTPEKVGRYELRLLGADQPYATLAKRSIELFKPEASIKTESTAPVLKSLKIDWSGPSGSGIYITLVPSDLPDDQYKKYVYLQGESGTVTLETPAQPGEYQLRYSTSKGVVLARHTIQVTDATATVSFPAQVVLGAKVEINWTGPENKRNYLTIVAPTAKVNEFKQYEYTTAPMITLAAPEVPGEYEVRLVSAEGDRVLAKGKLIVGGAAATVGSADSVEAVSEFDVSWTGPNNEGDYIAVTPVGQPQKYLNFAYTKRGAKFKMRAPSAPGSYELHYLTARANISLASKPLQVTPAKGVGSLIVRGSTSSSLVSSSAGSVAASANGPKNSNAGSIALILDASGSMLQKLGDQRRIELARTALTQLIDRSIQPGTPVALRVFGHRNPGGCETELLAPLAPLDRTAMKSIVAGINAKNLAKTPIAASLAAVNEDLAGVEGRALVVLVTDGEETCDGDPEAEIRKLKADGFDFALNIVGFAIDEAGLEADFQRWATLGGGRYFSAANGDALTTMIADASQSGPASYVVMQNGEQVATGAVDGVPVSLKAGSYELIVGDDTRSIDVSTGMETAIQLK